MAAPELTLERATNAGPERLITGILLGGLVLTVGYAFFLVLKPFLAGLAWAAMLAIAVQPVYRRLNKRLAAAPAALVTTAATAIALIGPGCFLMVRLASECVTLANRLVSVDQSTRLQAMRSAEQFWVSMQSRFQVLRGVDPLESLNRGILHLSKGLASATAGMAQNLLTFVALLIFVLLALFFLLRDGPALVAWLRRLSPLERDTTDRLFGEIRVLTEGSVSATLLIAIVQGVLGGGAIAILGLPSPVVWGAAFGLCSFVPVLGTSLVWIPAVLWLVIAGQHGKAIAMLLASVLIIGQVDNVLRPVFVSGRSRLNYEVSMLSVLGGVAAFGMLGLVLGPVVVAMITALVDVYLDSKEKALGCSDQAR